MSFESLSYRHTINIPDFPQRWLPLIYLYDPDLPLFPIYYFHVLANNLSPESRPSYTDRAFGYVERLNYSENNSIDVTIVLNKNLENTDNRDIFLPSILIEVKERLGLINPVVYSDITNTFSPPYQESNLVIKEIWHRVVENAYGGMLPFGRLWDEVLGFTRFVSSWNSPGGRKGELIQTHYFVSKFGEKIQSAGEIPQIDFYLLPTIHELTNINNPLNIFPRYSSLLRVAHQFRTSYCDDITINSIILSNFTNPNGGKFNTESLWILLNRLNINRDRASATECFNSFDKGPQRTVIFLMMLDDIRNNRLNPSSITKLDCGEICDGLATTYQSPKVIQIYAQQCFGNENAMPIDIWIKTFFKWPLCVYPNQKRSKNILSNIFSHAQKIGKMERLLWVAGQARKVHSSACNDALWCTKYSSNSSPRGANPLSCNICIDSIRNTCPAFNLIKDKLIRFNTPALSSDEFMVTTAADNNTTPNQKFILCSGHSIYIDIVDDFSPADAPTEFAPFPSPPHQGDVLTVGEFVEIY